MTCVTPTTPDVTPAVLREQMARWPTGVAVITTIGSGRPIGKTVNSFHATSLEPPLVGWCIDHRSSQFAEWMAADGYVVHVVAHDQAALMSHFATPSTDRFRGVDWVAGLDGMPVLVEPVPLRLECRVSHRLPAGDHTYLVGEVITITTSDAVPLCLKR
ncbi:flavin reductase family protein [Nocardioides sp. CER19]|uniref:flavin reductase family protein n=1 Tax=Nocardioides sp. CER19 TaxID=3038538 RepID=UPI0024496443|nr:flavin reductase family protein [Nocardioides sp. CER19]MDH2414354.1 flavin reductase family protein [Nocardioides sp. CER19]